MKDTSIHQISVGLLLPFGYNLYQVAIILDVFTKVNQWCAEQGNDCQFEVDILQTQGQINEYSNTFFHYPVINTLTEKDFEYIIIPPFDTEDIAEIVEKNKVFKDWISVQYQNNARVLSVGNGIALTAYCNLLDDKEVGIAGVTNDFFRFFPKVQRKLAGYLQQIERITLSSGSIRIFYLMFDLVERYTDRELVIRLAKYYQIDLNLRENRHYANFELVDETGDEQIDLILEQIHTQYSTIRSLDDVLAEYPESRRNFNRKFLEQIKMTPIEYLQNVRIAYAKHLLETTGISIEEIAHQVGYEDPKSFRIIFSRITGIQPLDYRKRLS